MSSYVPSETKLTTAEAKNKELERQLKIAVDKGADSEKAMNELKKKHATDINNVNNKLTSRLVEVYVIIM